MRRDSAAHPGRRQAGGLEDGGGYGEAWRESRKEVKQEGLPRDDDYDDGAGGGACWVVFVCATAQYPVSGLTAPLPLLLFRFLLLLRLLLIVFLVRVLPSLSRSRVSFNAIFSLSLAVPDADAVLGLSPVTYRAQVSFRCHAFALRLEALTSLHFLVRHAHCASLSSLPFYFSARFLLSLEKRFEMPTYILCNSIYIYVTRFNLLLISN